jgi:hypothetical protein
MAQTRYFSSTAQPTTLSASISNSQTSIPLAATTGFPVSFPYTLALDYGSSLEELVDVSSLAGLNANVTRGVDGTSAAAHSVGAVVRHVSSARDFNAFYIHMGASSGVHGIVGNVVGDTDTQTLTNKTLTSPIFSGTVTGTYTVNATGSATFTSSGTGVTPLTAVGFSGQTADLFDVKSSTPSTLFKVAATGATTVAPSSTTAVALTLNNPTSTTADILDVQIAGSTWFSLTSGQIVQLFPASGTAEILGSQASSVGSFDMFRLRADGRMDFGPGTATRDTNLYRNGVGILKTDTAFFCGATGGGTQLGVTGAALFTQTQAGGGSFTINGATGLPTTNVQVWQANGAQIASMDPGGNLSVNSIIIPNTQVGFIRRIVKGSDTSRASTTTVSADPDFVFGNASDIVNGGTYRITGYLVYTGAAIGTGDLKLGLYVTGGSVTAGSNWFTFSAPTITSANNLQATAPTFGNNGAYGTPNTGNNVGGPFMATFNVSSANTQISLEWAQNTSNATATTIRAGSWMILERIA